MHRDFPCAVAQGPLWAVGFQRHRQAVDLARFDQSRRLLHQFRCEQVQTAALIVRAPAPPVRKVAHVILPYVWFCAECNQSAVKDVELPAYTGETYGTVDDYFWCATGTSGCGA